MQKNIAQIRVHKRRSIHNANVERIFSLMQPQWLKERERFLFDSVTSILKLVYNFNEYYVQPVLRHC